MKTKKMLLTGVAAFIAAGAIGMVPVSATEVSDADSGETTVTYNNLNGATGDSGVWMVTFPAAIQFDDVDGDTKPLELELIGNNGYSLDDLNPNLQVFVSAKSNGLYQMKSAAGDSVDYSVSYPASGTVAAVTTNNANAAQQKVAELNPTSTGSKVIATAKLGDRPTKKGLYKDVITYTISHEGTELN